MAKILQVLIDELETAFDRVEQQGLKWFEITSADFPLPKMAGLFADMQTELEDGSGLMKLSGLPVDRYSGNQLQKLYFGLGVNFGLPIYQNRSGELMRLIRDGCIDTGKKYGQIKDALDDSGKPFLSSYVRTLNNGATLSNGSHRRGLVAMCAPSGHGWRQHHLQFRGRDERNVAAGEKRGGIGQTLIT